MPRRIGGDRPAGATTWGPIDSAIEKRGIGARLGFHWNGHALCLEGSWWKSSAAPATVTGDDGLTREQGI
jgi:hypothetical protein